MMKNLLLILAAGFALGLTSCNRAVAEDSSGTATIFLYTEDGRPVQNALVHFKSPVDVPNGLEVFKYTQIDGSATVKWDYDIFVDVVITKGGFRTCDAIRIIPGEDNEKDVTLYPFGSPGNGCP